MPVPTQQDPRSVVRSLVAGLEPHDSRELQDQQWVLAWIDSGAPLFRLHKPATPPQHLAVYAALIDEADSSVMLVAHKLARSWLMPGGHVDDGEDPRATVVRELREELGLAPDLHPGFGSNPFFLTVTWTKPPASHQDITLWFVFKAERAQQITPDYREFGDVQWFPVNDPAAWPGQQFDPEFGRFLAKYAAQRESMHA